MRKVLFILFLLTFMLVKAEMHKIGNGMVVTSTPTSYKMTWNQTSRNGGSVSGYISGAMKNGKRDGVWTVNISYNLFGDDEFRSGKLTMTRNYTSGIPNGPYQYSQDMNWRDGRYNPYKDKWVYEEPDLTLKETVSGGFNNGRPDGVWKIRSDRRGGYEGDVRFVEGRPVGTHRVWDFDTQFSEYDDSGFLYKEYEAYQGESPKNGWTYDKEEIPDELIETLRPAVFFKHPVEDDDYFFARGGELSSWLASYPSDASNDIPEVIGSYVRINGSGKDEPYRKYFGNSDYMAKKEEARDSREMNEKMFELYSINESLNILEGEIIRKCREEGVIGKAEEEALLKVTYSFKRREHSYEEPAIISNDDYVLRRSAMLKEYIEQHPEIAGYLKDPIVKKMLNSDSYHERDTAKTFFDLATYLSEEEESAVRKKMKEKEQKVRTVMSEAGLRDDIIDKYISSAVKLYNEESLLRNGNEYSLEFSIDKKSGPEDRYKCQVNGAPSNWDYIIQVLKTEQCAEKLSSLDEVTLRDFILYSILENMEIEASYKELSPGFRQAAYKCKLKGSKLPSYETILEQISNLKSKLPADYKLSEVMYKGTASNGLSKTCTVEEWKSEIGDKQIAKQWEKFKKHYKINSND